MKQILCFYAIKLFPKLSPFIHPFPNHLPKLMCLEKGLSTSHNRYSLIARTYGQSGITTYLPGESCGRTTWQFMHANLFFFWIISLLQWLYKVCTGCNIVLLCCTFLWHDCIAHFIIYTFFHPTFTQSELTKLLTLIQYTCFVLHLFALVVFFFFVKKLYALWSAHLIPWFSTLNGYCDLWSHSLRQTAQQETRQWVVPVFLEASARKRPSNLGSYQWYLPPGSAMCACVCERDLETELAPLYTWICE